MNDNFDKYLLSFFLLLFAALRVLMFFHHIEDQWTAHVFDNFQGALLGLITGMAMRKPPGPTLPPTATDPKV